MAAALPAESSSPSPSPSPSSTAPLIPAPRDSALAQSDLRGAPVLTLSEESDETEAEEFKSTGGHEDQSSGGGDAIQEAVVDDEGEQQSADSGREASETDTPEVPVATDTAAAIGVDEAQPTEDVGLSGEQQETAEDGKE